MAPPTLIHYNTQEKTSPPFAETLQVIESFLPPKLQKPRIGIVCGSGLSGLVDSFKEVVIVFYDKLPGFAKSTACYDKYRDIKVHLLLDFWALEMVYQLLQCLAAVMAKLGVKNLIITNAAGSLNPKIPVGTIVVIQDHLALPNLTGMNPLLGPQTSPDHPRFLPLSDAYSPSLRRLAFLSAHKLSLDRSALAEGIYAWVGGPTYETPAEGRFLRSAGADVVGMSTVPEVVVAREEGLNVVVLSLVTNFVVIPDTYRSIRDEVEEELAGKPVELPQTETVSHEEVLAVGKEKAEVMKKLVESIVEMIPTVPDLQ
ncbi:hypothetical protein C0995_007512 [Termitomyces sp. Mi166|nr:hypothetical protein C0995_007512 [Termitomyces sp. Mi166\